MSNQDRRHVERMPGKRPSTRRIRIEGWPPVSFRKPDTLAPDQDAIEQWEDMRVSLMTRWRGDAMTRVVLWLTFAGRRSQLRWDVHPGSVIRMLVRAGVIESAAPSCVVGVHLHARRSPIEFVDVAVRPAALVDRLHLPLNVQEMSRSQCVCVLRQHGIRQVDIAESLGVTRQRVSAWMTGLRSAPKIELAVRNKVTAILGLPLQGDGQADR